MKKVLTEIAFYGLLPFAGIAYLVVDNWRSIKRRKHRAHLHRIGKATLPNPFTDKW